MYIGIDPGKQGAICIISDSIRFIDLNKDIRDIHKQLLVLNHYHPIVAVEEVHAIYGSSAKSTFQFGKNVRDAELLAYLNFGQYHSVQPKIWQKYFGISEKNKSKRKQVIANKAIELEPSIEAILLTKRGRLLDGRSDAYLITRYIQDEHNRSNQ